MDRSAHPDDREAFRRLFDEHGAGLHRFLTRLARDRHDAEDLLQETFARLWRKRDQFRGEGSLEGYLRRVAYRTFLNARHRLSRGREPLPLQHEPCGGAEDPAERAARDDLRQHLLARVREEVDRLPDSWREPFVMFRFEGMTCPAIAELMGLTPKAVEMRVTKALRRVADRLKELRAEYGGSLPVR